MALQNLIDQSPTWYTRRPDECCQLLEVAPDQGLSSADVEARKSLFAPNRIPDRKRRPLWLRFLDQFTDFMILVLIAAAIISGVIGELIDAIAIIVIVVLNAIFGFIQEYRAEKALEALKKMIRVTVRVRRDGQVQTLDAEELVPGDIVLLEAGDIVPADLRLILSAGLRVDEASLTGESVPVDKTISALPEEDVALGDRVNQVFKGTLLTSGRGEGVVVATGLSTELGKIAQLLSEAELVRTPLQKRLEVFGRGLALLVIAICVLIFMAGLLRGESVILMFLTAISLAVAAIPEALPAVITIALALGARRMVRIKALARRLPAVETLGSVTYICSDKTGTLTQNSMQAECFYADGVRREQLSIEQEPWHRLALNMLLNNDAELDASNGRIQGDPTEIALFQAAKDVGLDKGLLSQEMPRVAELPFDSVRKRMSTFHTQEDGVLELVKGAPEAIVERCISQMGRDGVQPIQTSEILAEAESLAAEGYRVLAFAGREWDVLPDPIEFETVEKELTFIGLVALMDPPRPEALDAVRDCKTAGITPVMITGDHPATAQAMAKRLEIVNGEGGVISGPEFEAMDEQERIETVEKIRVYARMSPQHKIDIVSALQSQGEFVAMTGDGVNDAPALKSADIGVAMGQKGTDVARKAADLVLLDDNFATIVAAVREGRRIYDNIRKFIKYTMTSNSGEIWTLFLAPFLGMPLPLLPIQILWINLLTDGLPGLALTMERSERGIMTRSPRPPTESVFAHGMWQHMIWVGLLIGGLSLLSLAWAMERGSENWQTIVFTVLTLSQLVHAMAIRSDRDSVFHIGILSNRYLIAAILFTFALQIAAIYAPWFQLILKTAPLTLEELSICLALPWVVLVAVETEKWLIRRGLIYQSGSAKELSEV
jgi:Ca2+-transporting ATPase